MNADTYFSSLAQPTNNQELSPNIRFAARTRPTNDEWAQLAAATQVDIANVERAAVLLVAELAGLKVDAEIYRNSSAEHGTDRFILRTAAILPLVDPQLRAYTFECRGVYLDRTKPLTAADQLAAKLPLKTHASVKCSLFSGEIIFAHFALAQPITLARVDDDAREKTIVTISIAAQILILPKNE